MVIPQNETISSPQNPRVQLVRSLLEQPKSRRKQNAFVAEGARLVEDGLSSNFPLKFILYKTNHSSRVENLLFSLPQKAPVFAVDGKIFDDLVDTETSQGILAVFEILTRPVLENPDFVVILDQLRDPGNLGTILRSAEAAGVQAVCLAPGSVDPWSPKVVRSGMGSHFRLPIYSWSWDAINALTDKLAVFHADMQGEQSLWQADFNQPLALLIGGEAEGISIEGRHLATHSVRIPMVGKNESLNAAVSASVLLFEVLRQRTRKVNL